VTDYGAGTIRKVDTQSPYGVTTITTVLSGPAGITTDGTYLYVCDNSANIIRRVGLTSPYTVTTIAGTGQAQERDNTTGTSARFDAPAGIVYDGSAYLYVADNGGNTVRQVSTTSPYAVVTFAGTGNTGSTNGTGTAASFRGPWGITIDQLGNLYVADEGNYLVRMITTPGAVVTTLAGTSGTRGEVNGTGTAATFYNPFAIAADGLGNLFVGDANTNNSTCRQISLTGYAITPTLPGNLAFDVTTGTISGTPTTAQTAKNYTVTAYNTLGSGSCTISIAIGRTVAWTGSSSTAWTTGGNWSTFAQPGVDDAVTIGVSNYSGSKYQPTISTANVTVGSITFGNKLGTGNSTAALTLSGKTLTLTNGLTVNTTTTATIMGTGAGAVILSPRSIVNLSGALTLTSTSTTFFTLQSDATGDASIGQVATGGSITGSAASSINVQRYLTGGSFVNRGYRLLSSPVYAATLGTSPNQYNICSINYLISSIFLTGTTGTSGGFDATPGPNNPTLYLYRENLTVNTGGFTGGNFRGINNINAAPNYTLDIDGGPFNIPVANGYLCFFRGSRSTVNPFSTATTPLAATLTATGTLNIGNITVNNWFASPLPNSNLSYTAASPFPGFTLVGNPYASAIDWDTFQTTSLATGGIYGTSAISPTIYELDPVSHNFGAYMAGSGGTGTNNSSNIISSGQGFFAVATGTGAQLTFTESAKTSTQNTGTNLLMGKPVNLAGNQSLRVKLAKDASNAEDIVINFSSMATGKFTAATDAEYIQGYGTVNLSGISQDNIKVAIHSMPLPKLQEQALKLYVTASASGNYTLALNEINALPRLYDIWLIDHYMKDSLDFRQYPVYNLGIDISDTSSFGNNRFTLVIRQNQAYAYRLLDFTAAKVADARQQVQVNWKTTNEGNYTTFTVERSTDGGKTYSVIGGATGTGLGNYGLVDKSPVTGLNMYRLQQEDINNTITYSNIVNIQFSPQSSNLTVNNVLVYPNPGGSTVNLAIQNQTADITSYSIRFMNSTANMARQCKRT
jgi:hypothetical protein